ncbi:MAG TPA: DUF1360 domain-containing protein [Solirubrobacteraceae bacterium]|nr:DUF1360 domain-containing protein [Solirubrobacteraceae bacterium]
MTRLYSATDTRPASRHKPLASQYAPGQERPLGSYAIIAGTYSSALAGSLVALRARGHGLPERFGIADVLLIGIASHKLSRLLAKDKVTSFVRAPFTEFQEESGQGEVDEKPCGHGLRLAVGELLVCPYCLAQWVATALTIGLIGAPRLTRAIGTILVAHTVSDFLQAAYRAAEDQL